MATKKDAVCTSYSELFMMGVCNVIRPRRKEDSWRKTVDWVKWRKTEMKLVTKAEATYGQPDLQPYPLTCDILTLQTQSLLTPTGDSKDKYAVSF